MNEQVKKYVQDKDYISAGNAIKVEIKKKFVQIGNIDVDDPDEISFAKLATLLPEKYNRTFMRLFSLEESEPNEAYIMCLADICDSIDN